ncbi:MAG: succinate dehydrogenase cytochrome b subunit [Planctomycetes bacterium]|nr:succinate dehydrogenase cytochrome b subunit [Planctomycetota bacterium]
MSALASTLQSSIGKKFLMAVTGLVLFGFVVGHLLGNLQLYIPDGGKKINEYAEFLHHNLALLWGARIVLLGAVLVHILVAFSLAYDNRRARPVAYGIKNWRRASYASRTMIVSGPIIALFVVYHLLHFTIGSVHPSFRPSDVHHNLIAGFSSFGASFAYILAMLLLGNHLHHGLWSMLQTVGVNHPRYNVPLQVLSGVVGWGIALGNISFPVAVLMGRVT